MMGEPEDRKGLDDQVKREMRVSVQYHGRKVRMEKGEYRGKIIGFSPPGETFEDLAVDEEVLFRASSVCWIYR